MKTEDTHRCARLVASDGRTIEPDSSYELQRFSVEPGQTIQDGEIFFPRPDGADARGFILRWTANGGKGPDSAQWRLVE